MVQKGLDGAGSGFTSKGSFPLELPVARLCWKMRGLFLQLRSIMDLPKTEEAVSLAGHAKAMLTFCCSRGSSQPVEMSS